VIAGLVAAAVALGLLWGLSRVEPALRFPPLALGELVIRSTPGDVATFFIEQLQHWAIRSLAIGATVALSMIGALFASQGGPGGRAGIGLAAAAFGLLLFAASLGANVKPSVGSALAVGAIGAAAYGASLLWILGMVAASLSTATDLSRRRALIGAATAAAGFALGGTLLGRVLDSGARGAAAIAAPVRRANVPDRTPFPRVPGLAAEVTSPADHYVVDINLTKPVLDAGSWTLTVDGLVDRPLELGYEELQSRFGLLEQYSVLTCVSNEVGGPLIGNSKWTGVPLRKVLAEAGLRQEARDLLLTAADGYTVTIRPEVASGPTALLAVAQNGEPLTVEHGFPCRLRVPRLYGMMNCKWLERIEAVAADEEGYWAQRGWSDVAIVRTQSRIDTVDPPPAAGAESWIAGVAWAGDRGISRVEISTDGGRSFDQALLRRPLSPVAWSQWAYRWVPEESGRALLVVRAADGTDDLQTAATARPHPAGATGYHRVELEVI
jgi:DMSO/TMAO reductase YedYZ molybdopterin-dependent catalytic subunit